MNSNYTAADRSGRESFSAPLLETSAKEQEARHDVNRGKFG